MATFSLRVNTQTALGAWNSTGGGGTTPAPDTSNVYTATYDTAAKKSKADQLYSEVVTLTNRINTL